MKKGTEHQQSNVADPIGRYKLHKPSPDFTKILGQLQADRHYDEKQNFHLWPTDPRASNKHDIDEELQAFSIHVDAHRRVLSMDTKDPIIILRSSLPLRTLYQITESFATDPVKFMSEPLDQLPSQEQQLYEELLIYITMHSHPFLSFLYSTEHDFFLYFNIPIPISLESNEKPESNSKEEKVQPLTIAYLQPCMEQLGMLSAYYPRASRPIIITNSFQERVHSKNVEYQPFSQSCSSLRCSATQVNRPHTVFQRCSACKLVQYCSKACQVEDWERHKRFCHFHRLLSIGRIPHPLPVPQLPNPPNDEPVKFKNGKTNSESIQNEEDKANSDQKQEDSQKGSRKDQSKLGPKVVVNL